MLPREGGVGLGTGAGEKGWVGYVHPGGLRGLPEQRQVGGDFSQGGSSSVPSEVGDTYEINGIFGDLSKFEGFEGVWNGFRKFLLEMERNGVVCAYCMCVTMHFSGTR